MEDISREAFADEASWLAYRASLRPIKQESRNEKALRLRLQGLTFEQIARECGFAAGSGAYKAIKRLVGKTVARNRLKSPILSAVRRRIVVRERARRLRTENPELMRKQTRDWMRAHPEVSRAAYQRKVERAREQFGKDCWRFLSSPLTLEQQERRRKACRDRNRAKRGLSAERCAELDARIKARGKTS